MMKAWLPAWMHPVPPWAWLLLAIGLMLLFRLLWVEIGLRARQIRVLRGEREQEIRDFAEWNARWNQRHAAEDDEHPEGRQTSRDTGRSAP